MVSRLRECGQVCGGENEDEEIMRIRRLRECGQVCGGEN